MTTVDHVLRVFTDDEGRFGDFLGVYLGTADWPDGLCQERARDRGFSETVFIDNVRTGRIRIFTPRAKLPFAGHPAVGAAWLLDRLGHGVSSLTCDAGVVQVVVSRRFATILADPAWVPALRLQHVDTAEEVDAERPWAGSHDFVWAWLEEPAGLVRARAFIDELGMDEAEAFGAGAILLAHAMGRTVRLYQGRGSRLEAEPTDSGMVSLGGTVVMDR